MTIRRIGPFLALGVALAGAAGADAPVTVGTTVTLRSKVLNEERTLLVSVPPACKAGTHPCPVLYLTDGNDHFLHTVATTEFLARNTFMPPTVVVGITNTDRQRDLTPTHSAVGLGGRRNPVPTSGGADNFLKFIESEVVPLVEKDAPSRPYRILCGHSLGGLFALHALFSRPELFDAIVAVSPTLTWDDDLPLRRAHEFFPSRPELKKTLFVTSGAEGPEMDQAFGELQKILKGVQSKGFVSGTLILDDEDHGSVVLRSHYAGLRKVFEGWRPPVDPVTGALEGGLATIRRHYASLSERFNYPVAPPEGLVNRIGYAELVQGDKGRAVEAFRLNALNYPESANVHDSLGEGLEADGQLPEARDCFARAVALGEKSRDPNLETFRQHLKAVEARLKAPAP